MGGDLIKSDEDDDEIDEALTRALTFRLTNATSGARNIMETMEEIGLQAAAQERREVLLYGVDACTALAMSTGTKKVHARALVFQDTAGRENRQDWRARIGFGVFMHESWAELHHVVRYFDSCEKGELPDTSLLEWLTVCRAVRASVVKAALKRFRDMTPPLDEADCTKLEMAIKVAEEIDQKEGAKTYE